MGRAAEGVAVLNSDRPDFSKFVRRRSVGHRSGHCSGEFRISNSNIDALVVLIFLGENHPFVVVVVVEAASSKSNTKASSTSSSSSS